MSARKLKVFLCHSSGDKPAVRDLYKRLRADGFDPWLDEEDLLLGQTWEQEIPKAVRAADAIVVCLSQSSITKEGYVQKEISEALDVAAEKPEGTIFLIPLKLEDCAIPARLRRWQTGMLHEERGYEKLLRSLNARAESLGMIEGSPSTFFTISDSPSKALLLNPEPERTFRNSIGMDFVLIPAGEFRMGSQDGAHDEKPVHVVRITKPFYLGKYQVTQGQWQAVMGNNPSRFKDDPNRPVEQVSWEDTQEFLRRLSKKAGGKPYRLPTEAEWEYAARAGSTGAYCFGNDVSQLERYAWHSANAEGTTHPVGQLKANAWGLYDMHGNVWEWVSDRYDGAYYQQSPTDDPQGPEQGSARSLRGGSWYNHSRRARASTRVRFAPGYRLDHDGLRCAQ